MYRCEHCNKVVPRGRKVRRVVTRTRSRVYELKRKVGRASSKRKHKQLPVRTEYANGWETVRELQVCRDCAPELRDEVSGTLHPHQEGAQAHAAG